MNIPQLGKYTVRNLKQFRCYSSHHGRDMFNLIGRTDLPVITMLRNPVEQVASGFYYHQRMVENCPERFTESYLREAHLNLCGELQDCIEGDYATKMLHNAQTRSLGGRADYEVFLKNGVQAKTDRPFVGPYDIPYLIEPNDHAQLFAKARAWLDEMVVVGLTERYAESMLMISDLLGIPVPKESPRANVNPRRTNQDMRYRDQLAPDVVARLEELNRHDLELYAHASELFEQQWARYQARPRRTYSIVAHLRPSLRTVKALVKHLGMARP